MSIENELESKNVDLIELTKNLTIDDKTDRAAYKNVFALK